MNPSPIAALSQINSSPIIGEAYWVRYLRVPYKKFGRDLKGWDCFGAVRYILNAHKGIELPMFDFVSAAEIMRQSQRDTWVKKDKPQQFDVVCLKVPTLRGVRPLHVGIMVDDKLMLHCEEGFGTVCVPFNHITVKDRIQTIYRHRLCE
jgi:cell wall-associated NlpC family hydrolase